MEETNKKIHNDHTFLFNEIVFGPVKSRRLGISLGVNLLPTNTKFCNFNCLYCECGWNEEALLKKELPTVEEVATALERKLISMADNKQLPDVITFAGNGEPTLHPDFHEIIAQTISIRNRLCKAANLVVLSNATMLHKKPVFDALNLVDQNIQKLDSAVNDTFKLINLPSTAKTPGSIIKELQAFDGNVIIQTLFLKGNIQGHAFDNTTDIEVDAWLEALQQIQPKEVMIYTFSRVTPHKDLSAIPVEKLKEIRQKVMEIGIQANVHH